MSHLSGFPDTSETSEKVSSVAQAAFGRVFLAILSPCAKQTRRNGVHCQWTNRTKKGRGPKNRTNHLAGVHSQRAPTQKNRASRRGRRPENRLDCCPGLRVLFPCPALGSALSRLPGPLSGHSLCSWSWVTPSVLVGDDSRTDPFLKFRRGRQSCRGRINS